MARITQSAPDAVAACLLGQRVETDSTLSSFITTPVNCKRHKWRTVACDSASDNDVCECAECGEQRVFRCNFDEEYS